MVSRQPILVEAIKDTMTWLIVGRSGQLGTSLVRLLENQEISYYASNTNTLDITSDIQVNRVVAELKPNVIVNCAAFTDVDGAENDEDLAFAINAIGAGNLANAAKAIDATFVQISTDYVFSGESVSSWNESDYLSPINSYGRSKSKGEELVLQNYPLRSRIFRTAGLYSPYRKNIAKYFLKEAIFGSKDVYGVVDQFTQPTSSADLAEQILRSVLQEIPPGIYHATNAGQTNWYNFAKEIFKLVDADVERLIPVPLSEFRRAARRPTCTVLGHDKWIEVGMEPMQAWEQALRSSMPAIVDAVIEEVSK